MSAHTSIANEFRMIPLEQLEDSPTNPRRRIDETGLNELAESIKVKGILSPLLVRPLDSKRFQVVFGKRRFLAAKRAEAEAAPCRVKEMTDPEAIESQITENLQRQDIHPLEEAAGFHSLLDLNDPNYTIASIAAKSGKSASYVTTRLRLTGLVPQIQDAFLADQIGVGHALEIAKLPPSEQQRAFDAAFRTVWTNSKDSRVLLPVRDLSAWIEQNILLSLDSIPFDKKDETLVPEAGSCVNCPKRTGYNTLLFDAAVKDSCTDSSCYNNKLSKHIERQVAEKPKLVQIATSYGTNGNGNVLSRNRYVALNLSTNNRKSKGPLSPYQKPCKQMSEAIVVDGSARGQIVKVCADTTCAVHFADRRAPDPEQMAKERARRRKELEKMRLEITLRHRTLAEILKRVGSPLDRADLALVASAMFNKLEPLRRELLARRHKLIEKTDNSVSIQQVQQAIAKMLRQADEAALSKLLIEITLLDVVDRTSEKDDDVLTTTAKRHRVDVAKVRKAVEAEFAAKRAKQEAKEKKLKKSTAKPAA